MAGLERAPETLVRFSHRKYNQRLKDQKGGEQQELVEETMGVKQHTNILCLYYDICAC